MNTVDSLAERIRIRKIDLLVDSLDKVTAQAAAAYSVSEQLFQRKVGVIDYALLYSREEIDEYWGEGKTSVWQIGTFWKGEVAVLSESLWSTVGQRNPDTIPSGFIAVMEEETYHIFTWKIFGFRYPCWLFEGLANYELPTFHGRSIKVPDKDKLRPLTELHDKQMFAGDSKEVNTKYRQASLFVGYLIKTFGRVTLFNYCNTLRNEGATLSSPAYPYNVAADNFRQILGLDLEQVYQEWKDTLPQSK